MTAPDYQRLTDTQTEENLYYAGYRLANIEESLREVITRSDSISGVWLELLREHQERIARSAEFLKEISTMVERERILNEV
jgi:predicted transcriptional regulator